MIAAAYGIPVLALAGCAAWAARGRIRAAVLRARWAWRCRGRPPRNDGDPLEGEDLLAYLLILRGWGKTARTERSRT